MTISRSGLTPYDLAVLTGLDDLTVAAIRRSFGGLISIGGIGGRLRYRHSAARDAMWNRYVVQRQIEFDRRLARYLASATDRDVQRQDDALWHAMHSYGKPSAAEIFESLVLFDSASIRSIAVLAAAIVDLEETALIAAFSGLTDRGLRFLTAAIDDASSYHTTRLPADSQTKVAIAVLYYAELLADGRPIEDEVWRLLAISMSLCGNALFETGDLDGAFEHARNALTVGKAHYSAAPSATTSEHLIVFYERMAQMSALRGDDASALAMTADALVIARSNASGGEMESVQTLTARLSNAELLARRTGRRDLADEYRRESVTLRTNFLSGPSELDQASSGMNFEGESLDPRSSVLTASRNLVSRNPSSLEASDQLRMNLIMASSGAEQLQDYDLARTLASEAVQIARSLVGLQPANFEYQNDLAVSISQLARAAIMTDDLQLAADSYAEAMRIDRLQVAKKPSDTRAIRHLGVSLQGAGRVAQESHQYEYARALFEERLELLTDLAKQMGDQPVLLANLATASYDIADLLADEDADAQQIFTAYRASADCYSRALLEGCEKGEFEGFNEMINRATQLAEDLEEFTFGLEMCKVAARTGLQILVQGDDPALFVSLIGHLDNVGRMTALLGDLESAAGFFLRAAEMLAQQPKSTPDYMQARSIVIEHLRGTAKMLLRKTNGTLIAPRRNRHLASTLKATATLLRYSPTRVVEYLESKDFPDEVQNLNSSAESRDP
jgi:tetratricopeptide (TPR) repeat protein